MILITNTPAHRILEQTFYPNRVVMKDGHVFAVGSNVKGAKKLGLPNGLKVGSIAVHTAIYLDTMELVKYKNIPHGSEVSIRVVNRNGTTYKFFRYDLDELIRMSPNPMRFY